MFRTTSIDFFVVTLAAILLLAGCVGPTNPLSGGFYARHINLGLAAEEQGDYIAARKWFIRARAEADSNFLGKEAQSGAVYNIARMNGMLGHFEIAEQQFKEALALEEKVYGPDQGHASMRWFELARLYQAWGRYQDSAVAYDKAFSLADRLDAHKAEPGVYAATLRDFANVLDKTGEVSRAKQVRARAASFGQQRPEWQIKYYPQK